MTISDRNRAFFEDIGLEAIRRELRSGIYQYIPIDEPTRAQAREWINEKIAERRREQDGNRRWMIAGIVIGAIAAAAACIAAWPIVKGWIG